MKFYPKIVVRIAPVLVALVLSSSASPLTNAASFTNTAALSGARAGHSATLLPNKLVLVVGGFDGHEPDRLTSSELYDPAAGTWKASGAMAIGRTTHTATLLPGGKVLVAGGHIGDTNSTATCELYDPIAGTWTETSALATPRGYHTATLLLNGKVLVVGGYNRDQSFDVSSAELFDPVTGTWTPTGSLATARDNHTATLLFDGKVLVVGGAPVADGPSSLASAELYDPASGAWTMTGAMVSARQYHTAALLADGRVLVAGGDSDGDAHSSAELYDPATRTWRTTGALQNARTSHTLTLLSDGKVLAVGGINGLNDPIVDLSSAELFDPVTETWTPTGALGTARDVFTATLLPSGKVLIAGGYTFNPSTWLSNAEVYDAAVGPIRLVNTTKRLGGAFQFAFTGLANGTYGVLATTDLALPIIYADQGVLNWTVLGSVPEFSPGLYVFGDPRVTTSPQRFYQVVSGLPCQGPNPCPCAYGCVQGVWSHYATCRDCGGN